MGVSPVRINQKRASDGRDARATSEIGFVKQSLVGETNPTLIKTTKSKTFENSTLPDGTASADYYITAYRDDFEVNSAIFTIHIGANGATSI